MCLRQTSDGVLVTVTVRPRSKPRIEVGPDAVTIGVAAPPAEGRATDEARRALARAALVPPTRVTLKSGQRSRTKVFLISGATTREVEDALGALRAR